MASISGVTITLKATDSVAAYIEINGVLTSVTIQGEKFTAGPPDAGANDYPPVPPPPLVPQVRYAGRGGHIAMVSEDGVTELDDLFEALANEDSAGIGAYTVQVGDKAEFGVVTIDTTVKGVGSSIAISMKDSGSFFNDR